MADATKVFLRLKDKGSIFFDVASGVTITGEEVAEFPISATVSAALNGGRVDKVTEAEFNAWVKKNKDRAESSQKAVKEGQARRAAEGKPADVVDPATEGKDGATDEDEDEDEAKGGDGAGKAGEATKGGAAQQQGGKKKP